MCGGYNAQVVDAGVHRRRTLGEGPTLCVGRRARALLARRGITIETGYGTPTSVAGITSLLLRLAEEVLSTYATRRLSRFEILSNRFTGVGVTAPTSVQLLPLAPHGAPDARPVRWIAPERFATAAIREFLYVTLYDVLLDALASEHGARLIATQSAEEWLDQRTDRLRRRLAATRCETSTREMLEIAGGARRRRGLGWAR